MVELEPVIDATGASSGVNTRTTEPVVEPEPMVEGVESGALVPWIEAGSELWAEVCDAIEAELLTGPWNPGTPYSIQVAAVVVAIDRGVDVEVGVDLAQSPALVAAFCAGE